MYKSYKIVFLFISLFLIKESNAQNFLNGSFENCTAGGVDQINISNGAFNAMMANVTAVGTWGGGGAGGGDMDIITSASWGGSGAQNGLYYVGLTGGGSDSLRMDLSGPLVGGSTYTLTFYDRADASYVANGVEIGLSDGVTETSIYTAPVPSPNLWSLRTVTFVAPYCATYLTVRQSGIFSGSNWLHIDNFSLAFVSGGSSNTVTVGAVPGSPFCACSTISVPFTSTGVFTAGNTYSALLSDASGSFAAATTIGTLASTANAGTITCTIPCGAVAGAGYQIQVVTSSPVSSVACGGVIATVNITVGGVLNPAVNSPTICTGQTANLVASGATSYTWSAGATSTGVNTADATPLATTTYTVTGTTGGCTGTAVATVTVVAALTVTVTSPTICPGQTANLTAGGANTYTWSAGATSTGINTADASPVTTITYTVTGMSGACSATAVATVTVSNILNVTVNSPTICSGQTANLIATGATNYTWTAGATSTGGGNATATPVVTTLYTVTGTSGTCTNTAVATVTVNPSPNVTVNSVTICSGDTAHLISNGAQTYTWSAGTTVTANNAAYVFPITTTTYTVTGTTNGCSNTAISTVTVNPNPVITVNSDTICQGQTTTLTASGANSYLWSGGFIGNPFTATLNFTTFYTVTGSLNGCTTQAFTTIYVNPPAVVTVNVDTVCPGQPATLTASGCMFYLWNTGANTSSIVVSPPTTTTYTVTGNPTGCPGTATTTVQVQNVFPSVFVNSDSLCYGDDAVLTATGASNYTWSTGATTASIVVSPATTTSYTVTTTNQCNNSATAISLVAVKVRPTAMFSTTDTLGCVPLCVPFSEASTVSTGTIANWSWTFGDGQTDVVQNPALHCYTSSGSFNVKLIVTANDGCRDTLNRPNYIHVYPYPTAAFTNDPTVTNLDNSTINFFNQSTGQTIWQWAFGDTANSTVLSPSHTYTHPGTYPVTLIVSNNQGCRDTVVHEITINDNFEFYAPNSITPNEDDINEVFIPKGTGWDLNHYQLWIFDRWGNMCFNTIDPYKGWDGRANSGTETAASDVFVYKVEVKDLGGDLHKYLGTITIIK